MKKNFTFLLLVMCMLVVKFASANLSLGKITKTKRLPLSKVAGGITPGVSKLTVSTPTVITGAGTSTATVGTTAVVDNTLTITTAISSITGANVVIGSNLQTGDALGYTGTLPAGVTSSYNSATGVLKFTGSATPADYQALLRTVTFTSVTNTSSLAGRPITFSLGSALAYSGNNHFYEYVGTALSWVNAKSAAAGRTLFGLQGYLATITSAGENSFVNSKLLASAWLGGTDAYAEINAATGTTTYANQAASEGNFYWVTGPEKGQQFSKNNINPVPVNGMFNFWDPNTTQPDNLNGNENYLGIFGAANIYKNNSAYSWNDFYGDSEPGYIVEYGGMPGDPTDVLTYTNTLSLTAAPVISASASVGALSGTSGTASAPGNFVVAGTNIVGGISVTPPAGFEVSTDGVNFSSSLTVGTSGTVPSTTVYIRLAASDAANTYSGNIVLSSSGATNRNVPIATSTVLPGPVITTTGTLSAFTATSGTASAPSTFTVSGTNLSAPVTVNAPTGFEVSTDGINYSTSIAVGSSGNLASTTIYTRVAASAVANSYSGNITLTSTGASTINVPIPASTVSTPTVITGAATGTATAGATVVVDNTLAISTGISSITGANVVIGSNLQTGDALGYTGTLPAGVTSSYNSATGVLKFTGSATPAEYQALLRTVTFTSVTNTSSLAGRPITFSLGSALAYSGNNHFYEYVGTALSWVNAKSAAAGRTLFGLQGYLATITSAGENSFVNSKLLASAWLGGTDAYAEINAATGTTTYANQAASEGNFYWVTGPEKGQQFSKNNINPVPVNGMFNFWDPNTTQPDNLNGNENYLGIFGAANIYKNNSAYSWNDFYGDSEPGYIVEYGGMPGDPANVLTYTNTLSLTAANPTAPTVSGGGTFTYTGTAGGGGSLTGTTTGGAILDWYDQSTGGTKLGSGSPFVPNITNAGTYTFYAEARDPNTGLVSTTRVPVTFTILPAAMTVTASNVTKTYGSAISGGSAATGFTATGLKGSETIGSVTLAYGTGAAASAAANTYTGSVTPSVATGGTFIPTNYIITYVSGNIVVNKAALTIAADNKTKVYGAANPALTVSYTGFVNGDTQASLATAATTNTTATATSAVGTYTITASGASSNNYAITYTTGTLSVTSATLTITADNKTKVYGTANPALTVSYSGFVNGDNSSQVTAPTVITTATTASGAGIYAITASGAAMANYTIVYVPGQLVVSKAVLTVTADDKSRNYGVANPTFTVTYSGFVNGDTQASLTSPATATTTAGSGTAPGKYAITPNGGNTANYSFSYVNGTLTIIPLTNADASSLTGSTGSISPSFSSTVLSYSVSLAYPVTAYQVTLGIDPTATAKINGVSIGNGGTSNQIPLNVGNNTITIVVTAQDGVTTKTYTLNVYRALPPESITATNIMSPNGDGKNDYWVIKDIQFYPNNTVTIYDRGGRNIYSKHAYNNDWDGTVNGKPLVEGTYYYVVDLGDGTRLFKGYITILRSR